MVYQSKHDDKYHKEMIKQQLQKKLQFYRHYKARISMELDQILVYKTRYIHFNKKHMNENTIKYYSNLIDDEYNLKKCVLLEYNNIIKQTTDKLKLLTIKKNDLSFILN